MESDTLKKIVYKIGLGAREKNYMDSEEFYETPAVAIEKLLTAWTPPGRYIWEPACGRGAISEALHYTGYSVISSDLIDRGYGESPVDFFSCHETKAGIIVTNPPYNISTRFVEHACKICPVNAFLLRLVWLEGIGRYNKLFSKFPLSKVLVFSKRLPRMHKGDWEGKKCSSAIAFAWFIFDQNCTTKPEISWL